MGKIIQKCTLTHFHVLFNLSSFPQLP